MTVWSLAFKGSLRGFRLVELTARRDRRQGSEVTVNVVTGALNYGTPVKSRRIF